MEYALQETAYLFETAATGVWKGLRQAGQHLVDHVVPHPRNNYHPHILGHRTLALFSLLLVAVKVAVIASVIFETPDVSLASAITTAKVIELTNQSRTENNLQALALNSQLAQAAQAKADDMLARQYFAHNTPTGETPWSFINNAGYKYLLAGENLAVDFTESESVESAWMNSAGHRANILNKDFEQIGIGISEGQFEGHHSIIVVQMFGTPAEQPVTVQNAPTPVAQPVAVIPAPAVASAAVPTPAPAAPAPVPKPTAAPAPQPAPVASAPVTVAQSEPESAQPLVFESPAQEGLKIIDATAKVSEGNVNITVRTNSLAAKVLVKFGDAAIMLDPKADQSVAEDAEASSDAGTVWEGSVPLARVAGSNETLLVQAYDINGNTQQQQLASFSGSAGENFSGTSPKVFSPFNLAGAKSVSYFGLNINVKDFQTKFYLIFIAGVLAALALAIGIKRHVQHLSLVANSSFVVGLALVLWMAG